MKSPRHPHRFLKVFAVSLLAAAVIVPVATATREPGAREGVSTSDAALITAPLRAPVSGEDATSIAAIPEVPLLTENSNYNSSHSGEVASVPETLDSPAVLTENSNYNFSHSGEAVPQSSVSLDASVVLTENSNYNSSHSGEAVPTLSQIVDSAVILTENSNYNFSHSGESSGSVKSSSSRVVPSPRPVGHEDGGKDVSLGL